MIVTDEEEELESEVKVMETDFKFEDFSKRYVVGFINFQDLIENRMAHVDPRIFCE